MRKVVSNPEINRVAVWEAVPYPKLNVRAYERYIYMERGIVKQAADLGQTVVSYSKNYKRNKKDFSLIMISLENDTKKIEKFLDDISEKVKTNEIKGELLYTDFYYEGQKLK